MTSPSLRYDVPGSEAELPRSQGVLGSSSSNFVVWRTYCSITHTPPSDRSMLLSLRSSRTRRMRRERGRPWAGLLHLVSLCSLCYLLGSRFLDRHAVAPVCLGSGPSRLAWTRSSFVCMNARAPSAISALPYTTLRLRR